jgi:hypothetical protein
MPAGRPTIRTPEVEAKLYEALHGGSSVRDACDYAGIHRDTFYEWKREFPDFSDNITRAEAECAVRNGAILQKAANGYDTVEVRTTEKIAYRERTVKHPDGTVEEIKEPVPFTEVVTTKGREFDWRASLEWLKRRRRDEWSERQEVTGANGVPVGSGGVPLQNLNVSITESRRESPPTDDNPKPVE